MVRSYHQPTYTENTEKYSSSDGKETMKEQSSEYQERKKTRSRNVGKYEEISKIF